MSNDKLRDALAIVEKYGMKGDVIYKEIKALAASKPAPQAQAGEPEAAAWRNKETGQLENAAAFAEPYNWGDKNRWEPLITLQAHREAMAEITRRFEELKRHGISHHVHNEAIAKKDAALKACVEALERVEPHSGYGFFRPENPHDFFPDPESCTADEIANHKAACDAYDAGTYTPDNSDGWITPDLHITKAPWGIGSYTARDPAIVAAITQCKEAMK